MYLHRTLCDVLSEMKKCSETRNYSYLDGLIEEAQCMANRMEAGLGENKDIEKMHQDWSKLKCEINDLEQKRDQLKVQVGKK